MIGQVKEIYQYREMLKNMVKKDLRTRYKGSVLGFLWTFVNPLLQLVIYTVIFSNIMRMNIEKFHMFLFVALLPWIFFSTSLQVSTTSVIANKELVKKIYFPRVILPLSVVTANLMNFIFSFAILLPALVISEIGISPTIVWLPLVLLVEFQLALAFSILFAGLNVYFRDLEHLLGIVLMAWFYFTPIVYPVEMIPERLAPLFNMNPMLHIIAAFRDILYYGKAPDMKMLGIIFLAGFAFLIISNAAFNRLQRNFAEEI